LTTEFNGQKLLDGTFGTQQFQVGANANQVIVATTANLRTNVYGNNQINASGPDAQAGATLNTDGTPNVNGITAGTLTVNGFLGTKDFPILADQSASEAAAIVNLSRAETGVSATARTEARLVLDVGSYTVNVSAGTGEAKPISFSVSAQTADGLAEAVAAFNQQSSKTGVTASLDPLGGSITLTNANGENINMELTASTANGGEQFSVYKLNAGGGLGAEVDLIASTTVVTSGYLVLDSEKSFSLVDDTGLNSAPGAYVDDAGNDIDDATSSRLIKVADLDVTTFKSSTEALKTVDSALAFISGERAKLGALQSRFETTIANLQITSENLSASRSRIQDADFAAETAALSRAQILQQAGTAMVAQANQIPQGVLQLLQG